MQTLWESKITKIITKTEKNKLPHKKMTYPLPHAVEDNYSAKKLASLRLNIVILIQTKII